MNALTPRERRLFRRLRRAIVDAAVRPMDPLPYLESHGPVALEPLPMSNAMSDWIAKLIEEKEKAV